MEISQLCGNELEIFLLAFLGACVRSVKEMRGTSQEAIQFWRVLVVILFLSGFVAGQLSVYEDWWIKEKR